MIEDQVLAAIIQAILDKEPIAESEWGDYCVFCDGKIPQWPSDQEHVQHEPDCPWWRLKQFMEAAR